jgi:hypothetical protein
MTAAASIFLIAVGAILYFALNLRVAHVSIDTVGIILMIAGGAGLILGLIQQGIWARRAQRAPVEGPPPREPPPY